MCAQLKVMPRRTPAAKVAVHVGLETDQRNVAANDKAKPSYTLARSCIPIILD